MDAEAAVFSGLYGCANAGLDIAQDLAGIAHFTGPAGIDDNGSFGIRAEDGSFTGANGTVWNGAIMWNDSISVNRWVDQE